MTDWTKLTKDELVSKLMEAVREGWPVPMEGCRDEILRRLTPTGDIGKLDEKIMTAFDEAQKFNYNSDGSTNLANMRASFKHRLRTAFAHLTPTGDIGKLLEKLDDDLSFIPGSADPTAWMDGARDKVAELRTEFAAMQVELAELRKDREQRLDYSIALQRAIEHHVKGKKVPDEVAVLCPHHANMLDAAEAELAELREQAAMLRPVVEALESIRRLACLGCQFSTRPEHNDCSAVEIVRNACRVYQAQQALAQARAVLPEAD